MSQKEQCDCSRLELLEEKLESCRESKQTSCESEKNQLKSDLETTKKKLVMFQVLCAIAFAILGKEGANEAINYFTSVESVQVSPAPTKEVVVDDEEVNPSLDGPFRDK